ncbi:hypothetical protein, partial [uncultured Roseovarius sp.]|uniref:hypothetical protein n=1 Tax=uncultured Roseovarius sp. TaxID=293344 RepID=UPI002637261C
EPTLTNAAYCTNVRQSLGERQKGPIEHAAKPQSVLADDGTSRSAGVTVILTRKLQSALLFGTFSSKSELASDTWW